MFDIRSNLPVTLTWHFYVKLAFLAELYIAHLNTTLVFFFTKVWHVSTCIKGQICNILSNNISSQKRTFLTLNVLQKNKNNFLVLVTFHLVGMCFSFLHWWRFLFTHHFRRRFIVGFNRGTLLLLLCLCRLFFLLFLNFSFRWKILCVEKLCGQVGPLWGQCLEKRKEHGRKLWLWSVQTLDRRYSPIRTLTPMVPVFSLNLRPPFMAPNSGKFFLGFSDCELPLHHKHTSEKVDSGWSGSFISSNTTSLALKLVFWIQKQKGDVEGTVWNQREDLQLLNDNGTLMGESWWGFYSEATQQWKIVFIHSPTPCNNQPITNALLDQWAKFPH